MDAVPTRMSNFGTLLDESKSLCRDHDCPSCGEPDHVTAERVLIGNETLTLCHCRLCGHSWHPRIEPSPL